MKAIDDYVKSLNAERAFYRGGLEGLRDALVENPASGLEMRERIERILAMGDGMARGRQEKHGG